MARYVWTALRGTFAALFFASLAACSTVPTVPIMTGDMYGTAAPPPIVLPSTVEQRDLAPLAGSTVRAPVPVNRPVPTTVTPRKGPGPEGMTISTNRMTVERLNAADIQPNPMPSHLCPYTLFISPTLEPASLIGNDDGSKAILMPPLGQWGLTAPGWMFVALHECAHVRERLPTTPENEFIADRLACKTLLEMNRPDAVQGGIDFLERYPTQASEYHPSGKDRIARLKQCLAQG